MTMSVITVDDHQAVTMSAVTADDLHDEQRSNAL